MSIKPEKGWNIYSPATGSRKLNEVQDRETKRIGKDDKDPKTKPILDNYSKAKKSSQDLDNSMQTAQQMGMLSTSMFNAVCFKDRYTLAVTGKCLSLSSLPGITKPSVYLNGITGKLDKKKYNVKSFKTTIGGKSFDAVSYTIGAADNGGQDAPGTFINYCAFINGYALVFTANAPAGKEKELDQFFKSIIFK